MVEDRKKRSFGFLICGMVIGLSLGIAAVKRMHALEFVIFGPILGAIAGAFLEAYAKGGIDTAW